MTAPCRLLALDLDGTLLRRDGSLDPSDLAAVRRACAAGLRVVLASGRLPGDCARFAEMLALEQPLICADGAGIFSPRGERALSQWPVPPLACQALIEACRGHQLLPMFLSARAVYGRPEAKAASAYLSGWSAPFRPVDDWAVVVEATDQRAPLVGFAVGPAEALASVAQTLTGLEHLAIARFELGPNTPQALRLRHARTDKGQALAALAAMLSIPASAVGAVGDWYNDVEMLRFAGHSFVMGGAPAPVVASARTQLRARGGQGGGVAEVIRALLDGRRSA